MNHRDAAEAVKVYEAIQSHVALVKKLDVNEWRERTVSITIRGAPKGSVSDMEEIMQFNARTIGSDNDTAAEIIAAAIAARRRRSIAFIREQCRRLAQIGFERPANLPEGVTP